MDPNDIPQTSIPDGLSSGFLSPPHFLDLPEHMQDHELDITDQEASCPHLYPEAPSQNSPSSVLPGSELQQNSASSRGRSYHPGAPAAPAKTHANRSSGHPKRRLSLRCFTAVNEYAAVSAPSGSPRSVRGPYGPGSAVPIYGFSGYLDAVPPHSVSGILPQNHASEPGKHDETSVFMCHNRLSGSNERVPVPRPGIYCPPGRLSDPSNVTEKFTAADSLDRFEQFILAEGEKKCVGKPDTRTPNTAIFTFAKEDHTLGNLLKCHLMKDKRVLFSGYKVPHPLIPNFELRVQTDGTVTPKDALVSCIRGIVVDLDTLSREFTKEFELRKIVTGDN